MVLLILRNISFENDLPIEEDHVSSIQVDSPHLYARLVQSFLALEAGENPPEPFLFLQDGKELDASKLLCVVSDPFHIDFSGRKITAALYGEINQLIQRNPLRQAQWEKQMLQTSELLQKVCLEIPLDICVPGELTVQDLCKACKVQIDCPPDTPPLMRICKLMDILAEWMPEKLLVLCNLDGYFSEADWSEVIKYACYTKVRLLLLGRNQEIPLNELEIRWIIDQNFDDKIVRV